MSAGLLYLTGWTFWLTHPSLSWGLKLNTYDCFFLALPYAKHFMGQKNKLLLMWRTHVIIVTRELLCGTKQLHIPSLRGIISLMSDKYWLKENTQSCADLWKYPDDSWEYKCTGSFVMCMDTPVVIHHLASIIISIVRYIFCLLCLRNNMPDPPAQINLLLVCVIAFLAFTWYFANPKARKSLNNE